MRQILRNEPNRQIFEPWESRGIAVRDGAIIANYFVLARMMCGCSERKGCMVLPIPRTNSVRCNDRASFAIGLPVMFGCCCFWVWRGLPLRLPLV